MMLSVRLSSFKDEPFPMDDVQTAAKKSAVIIGSFSFWPVSEDIVQL